MPAKTIAIIVALAALIGGGAVAATLLTSTDEEPETLLLVPQNSFIYVEGSRVLQDEQREACDALVEGFPDVGDCGSLGDKLREALDGELAKEDMSFEGDIEPWLGTDFTMFMTTENLSQLILSSQEGPDLDLDSEFDTAAFEDEDGELDMEALEAQAEEARDDLPQPVIAGLATVDDEEQAVSFIERVAEMDGTNFETRSHQGTEYFYDAGGAWAVFDGHLVVATEDGMKAVIDQRDADRSIEDNERFTDALEAARDERLGLAFLDLQPPLNAVRDQLPAGVPPALLQPFNDIAEVPVTVTSFLQEDGLVMEATSSGAIGETFGGTTAEGGGEEALKAVPQGSWVAGGSDDLAGQFRYFLNLSGSAIPGGAEFIEEQLRLQTGLDLDRDVLDWMGPSAFFVGGVSLRELYGGLSIETSDPTTTVRTILRVERLVAREGTPTEIINRSGFRGFIAKAPGQPQMFMLVADDERAVGAVGTPSLLDELSTGPTLGDTERFAAAEQSLGDDFAMAGFLELDAIRTLIESSSPIDELYTSEVQPFLEPLQHAVFGSRAEGDVTRSRVVIGVE